MIRKIVLGIFFAASLTSVSAKPPYPKPQSPSPFLDLVKPTSPNNLNSIVTQGWNNTAWGMTESQVIELYPNTTINYEYTDRYTSVRETKIEVLDRQFNLYFGFINNQLVAVWLKQSSDDIGTICARLESSLVNKYGRFFSHEDTVSSGNSLFRGHIFSWLTSIETINLICSYSPYTEVTVVYKARVFDKNL